MPRSFHSPFVLSVTPNRISNRSSLRQALLATVAAVTLLSGAPAWAAGGDGGRGAYVINGGKGGDSGAAGANGSPGHTIGGSTPGGVGGIAPGQAGGDGVVGFEGSGGGAGGAQLLSPRAGALEVRNEH